MTRDNSQPITWRFLIALLFFHFLFDRKSNSNKYALNDSASVVTKKQKSNMNKKKYKAEQVGLLWMLTGEDITGAEIFAKLTDIPSRFFENLEIIPDTKGGSK